MANAGSRATVSLYMSETATNPSANTSTVGWSLSVYNDSAYRFYNNYNNATYSVSGNTSSSGNFSYDLSGYASATIASGSFTVTHNSDGTGSASLSASVNGNLSPYFTSWSGSASVTLTAFPRVSSISLSSSSVAIGGTQTITVTKASSSYTDVLTYSCGGASGTISNNASGNVSWTIPTAIEAGSNMGTATSATCTVTCTTKNGSTTVGTTSKTFTVTIPSSYKPTITTSTKNLVDGFGGKAIQGYSRYSQIYTLAVTTTGSYVKLKSYTVTMNYGSIASTTTLGSNQTSKSITSITSVLPTASNSYSAKMTVTVTDTRNRTATKEITLGTVYPFDVTAINITNLYRCDSSGAASPSGTYAYISATVSSSYTIKNVVCNINNTNYTMSAASGSYVAKVGGGNLAISTQYTAKVTVTITATNDDDPDTTITKSSYVTQILPTMAMPISLYDNGSAYGVTIGRIASQSGLNVFMPSTFNDEVDMIDRRYKMYYSVTDLGFTSGDSSTTISAVYTAMPDCSILIGNGSTFADTMPSQYGVIEIVKVATARAYIRFYGKEAATSDYRMYLNTSNVPSGTWICEIDSNSFVSASGTSSSVSIAASTSSSTTVSVTIPSGYKALAVSTVQSNGAVIICYTTNDVFGATGTQTLTVWYRNPTSSALSDVTFTVRLLCCKN